jgi:hypothetical protein
MKALTSILSILALVMAITVFTADNASAQTRGNGYTVRGFVDENGDGFNDLAPDADGDGIPNGQDPDYNRPQDGSGSRNGNGGNIGNGGGGVCLYQNWYGHMYQLIFGNHGETRGGGYGPGDGTGNGGDGPHDGTGNGPGGDGDCDGTGPHRP